SPPPHGTRRAEVTCIGISNGILLPLPRGQRGAYRLFPSSPNQTFCLYTVHMCSIVGDKSWPFHLLPTVRGGSYGASGSHLRTSGSQPDGARQCDCRAPGDFPRLVP